MVNYLYCDMRLFLFIFSSLKLLKFIIKIKKIK